MGDFGKKAPGFVCSTQLPASDEERTNWQLANKNWWEAKPMRYDFSEELQSSEQSHRYFNEIDERFFEASSDFAVGRNPEFSGIIDYEFIRGKDVLEIGVGMGTHAQLLSVNCASYTGVDLTEYATQATARRLKLRGVSNARVMQMNAEELSFPNSSFDYVWTWGVIHHSADTPRIVREMERVLRPNGRSTIMVYYRSWWYRYVYAALFHGILRGFFFSEKSLDKVVQRTTDGALARFYSEAEFRSLLIENGFSVNRIRVMGTRTDILIFPPGRIKKLMLCVFPRFLSSFLTTHLRMGYLIVADVCKGNGHAA